MSDNRENFLGVSYYCFASSEGEVFSGGGSLPRDAYIDEITDTLNASFKKLTDEHPYRTIVLTIECEPDNLSEWTEYKFLETRRNQFFGKLASLFYSIGFWFSKFTKDEKRIVKIVKTSEEVEA